MRSPQKAHLPYPDEGLSEPRLRRVSGLGRWCVRALVGTAIFGVGFSVALLFRYGNRALGGTAASVGLAALTVCMAVPYVLYTRSVKRRLGAMANAHAAAAPRSLPEL